MREKKGKETIGRERGKGAKGEREKRGREKDKKQ